MKQLKKEINNIIIISIAAPLLMFAYYLMFDDNVIELFAGICFAVILCCVIGYRKISKLLSAIQDERSGQFQRPHQD